MDSVAWGPVSSSVLLHLLQIVPPFSCSHHLDLIFRAYFRIIFSSVGFNKTVHLPFTRIILLCFSWLLDKLFTHSSTSSVRVWHTLLCLQPRSWFIVCWSTSNFSLEAMTSWCAGWAFSVNSITCWKPSSSESALNHWIRSALDLNTSIAFVCLHLKLKLG